VAHRAERLSRLRPALALTLAGALAIGCGSAPPAPAEETAAPRIALAIGTAPPGGSFHIVGGAITEILNARADEGWSVTVESTNGSRENIRRLSTGELDFVLSNATITRAAVQGGDDWGEVAPLRIVMTIAPNVGVFVTRAGSGIRRVADLEGRTVVVGPAGAGFEYFLGPLLEAHGVAYDDFTPLNATQSAAMEMLADGSAAAAFVGGASPVPALEQAASTMELAFVEFDPDAIETLVSNSSSFERAEIQSRTYTNQRDDVLAIDVGAMQLVTTAGQTDEMVANVAKAIYESRTGILQRHPAGAGINPQNVIRNLGNEFHPGAVRYFQQIGIWPR